MPVGVGAVHSLNMADRKYIYKIATPLGLVTIDLTNEITDCRSEIVIDGEDPIDYAIQKIAGFKRPVVVEKRIPFRHRMAQTAVIDKARLAENDHLIPEHKQHFVLCRDEYAIADEDTRRKNIRATASLVAVARGWMKGDIKPRGLFDHVGLHNENRQWLRKPRQPSKRVKTGG